MNKSTFVDHTMKKYYVTCQLLSFHYSSSRGAILLIVKSDIGNRMKLWVPCQSLNESQHIEEELEYSDYWRFRCYTSGQIIRREAISALAYHCVVQ